MRPKVIYTDGHLQWSAWASRPEICGDSLHSFKQIVEYAQRIHADTLIGGGDIFDSVNQPEAVVHFYLTCLEWCHDSNIAVYEVKGQHDDRVGVNLEQIKSVFDDLGFMNIVPDCPAALSSRSSSLHQRLNDLEGMFAGLSYVHQKPDLIKHMYDDVPGAPILITHQVYSDFARGKPRLEDVPDRFNMVITGDFHEFRLLVKERPSGKPLVVISPGSTCMQSIDEPVDKYFLVIAEKDSVLPGAEFVSDIPGDGYWPMDHLAVYRVKLQTRQLFTVTDEKEGLLAALRSIEHRQDYPSVIRKPLIQVYLGGRSSELVEAAREAVGDRGHLFFKYPGANKDNNHYEASPPVLYGIDRENVEKACLEVGATARESTAIAALLEAADLKKSVSDHFNWTPHAN